MKRAALYTRVSTVNRVQGRGEVPAFEQNPEVQEIPLRQLCEQRGWTVHRVYSDRASGAKDDRPGLTALMQDARQGDFDIVLVWRFDRFARSVERLVMGLAEFKSLGVGFVSHQESLDTSTPMGKAMFTIIAAMAELERNVIKDRVQAGLDYAKANGTKSGKAIGRPRAVFHRSQVQALRATGLSWKKISEQLGVSVGAIRREFHKQFVGAACSNPSPVGPIANTQTNDLPA